MFFNSSSTGTQSNCHVIGGINTCAEINMKDIFIFFGAAAAIVFLGAIICYCRNKRRVVNDESSVALENTSQIVYNRI